MVDASERDEDLFYQERAKLNFPPTHHCVFLGEGKGLAL